MGLKVAATPDWQGDMETYRNKLSRFADKPANKLKYCNYASPQALIDYLTDLLKNSDDCLEELEIVAHGNPSSINGIFLSISPSTPSPNMSWKDFTDKLHALRLCPEFKLYLTACNTGNTENGAGPGLRPMGEEIGKRLRSGTTGDFPKVYGAKGYVDSGTHSTGDTNVSTSGTHSSVPYPGASSGSGEGAYRELK